MLTRLLRKLFRRSDQSPKAIRPPAELPAQEARVVAQGATAPAHQSSAFSNISPAARWAAMAPRRGVLAETLAPGIPDARALIELLDQDQEQLVRQLPSSARDALALCDDPNLTRDRLALQIGKDPSLVQALLRTANSAAFGIGRETVVGTQAALDRIGLGGARGVLLSSCASGLLSFPGGEYNTMANDVWAHMIRCGPIAKAIAPAFAADADEAFTLALLHDIGKLIVFDRLSVLRATRRRAIELPAPFINALLNEMHEPLGALVAARWQLGDRACSALANHHRTRDAEQRESLSEVLFVAELADHAIRRQGIVDLDEYWRQGRLSGSPARTGSALQLWAASAA